MLALAAGGRRPLTFVTFSRLMATQFNSRLQATGGSPLRQTVAHAQAAGPYDIERLDMIKERLRSRLVLDTLAHPPVAPKLAAVLVPLFAKHHGSCTDELRVVLTRRSAALQHHPGEVCLPGGKREADDRDDITCALREANEELGLTSSNVEVLGLLPPLLSKHYLSVRPVAAIVPAARALHAPCPNPEVAEVFDVPLNIFLSSKGHSCQDVTWQAGRLPHWSKQEYQFRVHSFDYCGHTIWGLTAAILIKVAKLAYNREPSFMEHAPKGLDYNSFWWVLLAHAGHRQNDTYRHSRYSRHSSF